MIRFFKTVWDKLLLALAGVALLAGGVWAWQHQPAVRRLRGQRIDLQLTGSTYVSARAPLRDNTLAIWPEPQIRASGSPGRYEMFTAPAIRYDARSGSFILETALVATADATPFGLELLVIKRAPFRVQLSGYIGEAEHYLLALVSPGKSGTMLVRVGDRVEDFGLRLKRFERRNVPLPAAGSQLAHEVVAFAVLEDEQTGAEVELNDHAETLTDTGLAVCRTLGGDRMARELREGETFADQDVVYRIDRIQLDPAEVRVVKEVSGQSPVVAILYPQEKNSPRVADQEALVGSFPVQPAAALTANRD